MKKKLLVVAAVIGVTALTGCQERKINYDKGRYTTTGAANAIETDLEQQNKGMDLDVTVTIDDDGSKKKKSKKRR
jgi:outer membrane murein-binding lipoprotein Lpp